MLTRTMHTSPHPPVHLSPPGCGVVFLLRSQARRASEVGIVLSLSVLISVWGGWAVLPLLSL